MISLKTMSRAVSCESAPFMRTVRWRTVAKALSIGFDVRRCVQCSAGKSKNASRSLRRQSTSLSYLGAYFSAKAVIAASATARFRRARFRADPDARWAEPTSAACRERSGSCAASIVGDGSRERLRPGPSKSRAPRRPPRCQARSTDPAPLYQGLCWLTYWGIPELWRD